MFQNVRIKNIGSNVFDLSHEKKLSMKMTDLVPILCEEVIPNDSWSCNTELFIRFSPLVSPVMHRVNVFTHFFFVPHRLVWEDWEDFITGGREGDDATVLPFINMKSGTIGTDGAAKGTLNDYLGGAVKTQVLSDETLRQSALPFRAYTEICDTYYRDQNLTEPYDIDKGSGALLGAEAQKIMTLRKRCWEKDYFTSALPWTQRRSDAVELPLTGDLTVVLNSTASNQKLVDSAGGKVGTGAPNVYDVGTYTALEDNANADDIWLDPNNTLTVDAADATMTDINELRNAHKLQQWLELMAKTGARYAEVLKGFFGIKRPSDSRLQRPEYLGGGIAPVTFGEINQTSEDGTTPLGHQVGKGYAVGNSNRFKKWFEEHGYIIGIMSVMPKTAYYQGMRRHFGYTDKYDFFWSQFANLGEQEVYNSEIYADWDNYMKDSGEFGYQERYCQYKQIPDGIHGDFRDDLEFWHMGRKFASAPSLNTAFVQASTDDRIFADQTDEDKLYVQVYHSIRARRRMPRYVTPSL